MSERVLVVYRESSDVQPYARAIESVGAEPVLEEVRTGLRIGPCCGLLLTGGGDVDPALYGEIASPETDPPDPERDAVEAALIDEALARDLPLLGICRGMQLLNVHLGAASYSTCQPSGAMSGAPPTEACRPTAGDRARQHAGEHRSPADVGGELTAPPGGSATCRRVQGLRQ